MLTAIFGFMTSGGGRIVILVFALLAWTAWNRHDAASSAWAKAEIACRDQVAEKTAAELARQREVSSDAIQAALERAAKLEEDRNGLRQRLAALADQIRQAPDPGCLLSDDLIRELQSIR